MSIVKRDAFVRTQIALHARASHVAQNNRGCAFTIPKIFFGMTRPEALPEE
jgi:hypothetical protein